MDMQCKLVHCCFILHNFIRLSQSGRDEFDNAHVPVDPAPPVPPQPAEGAAGLPAALAAAKQQREHIAQQMWDDYLAVLQTRQQGVQ
jgi:hypothetical protein